MAWWGKALGGAFGFMLGGPLGALMGIAFGHNFDRGLNKLNEGDWPPGQQNRVQAAFFTATFSVMGYIAKADGRVSREEIALANSVMSQLGLDEEMRLSARKLFSEGKTDDFPLADVLKQFRTETHRRTTLIRMFLEIQIQIAFADGKLDPAEEAALIQICECLGVHQQELEQLMSMIRAGQSSSSSFATDTNRITTEDAYALLGVKATDSDAEIKKAYRRAMSQHHPDKLVSKGLPEEMIKLATEKTQQIKMAYEQVKRDRALNLD